MGRHISDDGGRIIVSATKGGDSDEPSNGRIISLSEAFANAAFIVRAVNCHDELVGLVSLIQKGIRHGKFEDQTILSGFNDPELTMTPLSDMIAAALAKANTS